MGNASLVMKRFWCDLVCVDKFWKDSEAQVFFCTTLVDQYLERGFCKSMALPKDHLMKELDSS